MKLLIEEQFWRLRAAFWFWWTGCRWNEVGAAWDMARVLDYVEDRRDVFYQSPREAVACEISYWEP